MNPQHHLHVNLSMWLPLYISTGVFFVSFFFRAFGNKVSNQSCKPKFHCIEHSLVSSMAEAYLDSGSCRGMGGDVDTLIHYCQPMVESELQCGICLGIVDDPVSCGHECIGRYCHGCLSRALQSPRSECPTCKRETHRPVRDLPLKARLGRMDVFCPKSKITQVGQNVGENCCTWRGPLDQWNTHNLRECVYSTVRCLCKQDILRSQLVEHQEKCFRQVVRCKCQLQMFLGQLSQHIKECDEAILKCTVCGERVPRRMCAEHVALRHHYHQPDPNPEDLPHQKTTFGK